MASVPNGFVPSPMDVLLPQHLLESALLASGSQPPTGKRSRRRSFSSFAFCRREVVVYKTCMIPKEALEVHYLGRSGNVDAHGLYLTRMVHLPLLSGPAAGAVFSLPLTGLPSPPLDDARFAHSPQLESRIPVAHRREAMATAGQPKVSEHPASCTYQDEPSTWITNALRRFTSPHLHDPHHCGHPRRNMSWNLLTHRRVRETEPWI